MVKLDEFLKNNKQLRISAESEDYIDGYRLIVLDEVTFWCLTTNLMQGVVDEKGNIVVGFSDKRDCFVFEQGNFIIRYKSSDDYRGKNIVRHLRVNEDGKLIVLNSFVCTYLSNVDDDTLLMKYVDEEDGKGKMVLYSLSEARNKSFKFDVLEKESVNDKKYFWFQHNLEKSNEKIEGYIDINGNIVSPIYCGYLNQYQNVPNECYLSHVLYTDNQILNDKDDRTKNDRGALRQKIRY